MNRREAFTRLLPEAEGLRFTRDDILDGLVGIGVLLLILLFVAFAGSNVP